MKTSSPRETIDLLQTISLRDRTAIWLMPVSIIGKEADYAALYNIDAVDIREKLIATLPGETRYVGLSYQKIILLLDDICCQSHYSECVLIYNFDLLMAKLSHQDCTNVWSHLFCSFPHRQHALLIAMPQEAYHLLPSAISLKAWNNDRRIATTNPIEL